MRLNENYIVNIFKIKNEGQKQKYHIYNAKFITIFCEKNLQSAHINPKNNEETVKNFFLVSRQSSVCSSHMDQVLAYQ